MSAIMHMKRVAVPGATLVFALAGTVSLGSAAQAVEDSPPPPAVSNSLEPGGAAFEQAVKLNTMDAGQLSTLSAKAVESQVSFGVARQSEYLELDAEGPAYITPSDYFERGDYWLAVEYLDGEAYSTIEVSSAGEFLTLDGWVAEEVAAIDALPEDAVIATDGRFGEAYGITDGGTVAHALNAATAEFLGGTSVSIANLRGMKDDQAREVAAAEPDVVEPDAVGGALGATPSATPNAAWFWITGTGVVLVGLGAFALGRGRSRSRV